MKRKNDFVRCTMKCPTCGSLTVAIDDDEFWCFTCKASYSRDDEPEIPCPTCGGRTVEICFDARRCVKCHAISYPQKEKETTHD